MRGNTRCVQRRCCQSRTACRSASQRNLHLVRRFWTTPSPNPWTSCYPKSNWVSTLGSDQPSQSLRPDPHTPPARDSRWCRRLDSSLVFPPNFRRLNLLGVDPTQLVLLGRLSVSCEGRPIRETTSTGQLCHCFAFIPSALSGVTRFLSRGGGTRTGPFCTYWLNNCLLCGGSTRTWCFLCCTTRAVSRSCRSSGGYTDSYHGTMVSSHCIIVS